MVEHTSNYLTLADLIYMYRLYCQSTRIIWIINAAGIRHKGAFKMRKVKLNNSFLFVLNIEQPAYAYSGCIGAGGMPMGGTYRYTRQYTENES